MRKTGYIYRTTTAYIARVLAPFYRSLYFPPMAIFAIITVAAILVWQGAKDSLGNGMAAAANVQAVAGWILFFGIFSAVLIATVALLLLRARARDLNTQKERAVEGAKDELLSLASHQLRTPATGVKQYLGMVLQGFAGKIPDAQRRLLEKAYASNDRQLRIINEILHLAKIDSGRIVLAPQETNLGDLITDIVNEQRPDIASASHTIDVRLPEHPVMAEVDVHMLRMAIENIVSNAIKYTPGGGKIVVRVHREAEQAVISIQDTGIGINTGDVEKIFKQFARLPNEMSQAVGGTGIGLYLAKHLVEAHKGFIKVSSARRRGSTFTVVLPIHATNIPTSRPQNKKHRTRTKTARGWSA